MTTRKTKTLELLTRPDIPTPMRKQIEDMKGYNLQLVIQKQLEDIEVNKNKDILVLPFNKLLFDFTTVKERELLNKNLMNNNVYRNNRMVGLMEVKILDEGGRERSIFLKKSVIERRYFYCLTGGWNSFVNNNLLESGDIIQLWSFRRERLIPLNQTFTSDLYFALNKLDSRICL